jgi:taurine dioxygenase
MADRLFHRALDMTYETLDVSPLTPHMGGVVSGLDLNVPLSPRQAEDLRRALIDRHVLFFHDQPLGFAGHKALARVFGDIHIAPSTRAWAVPDHPEITRMHADADSKYVAGEDWHSDMTCDPEPPLGSILYLHTVPPTGGDTVFSNAHLAYDALSDRMKAYLDGLTATHDGARVFAAIAPAGTRFPVSSHPVIRTHPVSGRKAIFVNKQFTARIDGVAKDEGEAVLDFLVRHIQRPEFQCRFRWRPHSIALWDNRSVQHSAIWDYFPQVRSGYRVTIRGDRPF